MIVQNMTNAKAKAARPTTTKKKKKVVEPKSGQSSASPKKGTKMQVKICAAEWAFKRMAKYISDFEEGLNDDEEIGSTLVSADSGHTFHIEDMGFWSPDMITFDGKNERGDRIRLVQHVSQLNVCLLALKKPEPEKEIPARRIGFMLTQKAKKTKTKNT